MSIELYGYTSCSSCRKADAALKECGADYVYRDYFRHRFSQAELAALLERARLTPRDVLSRRSKIYHMRKADIDKLDDDGLLQLMVEEPTLLRRPIVIWNDDVLIGHDAGRLAALVQRVE